jgi:osmotically-inducible protein OsmY
VQRELRKLPCYGVFDYLEYQVDGDAVTLMGQVTQPTLKNDAEAAVKRIEGVERVFSRIEVLPLSPFDDAIRRRVYYALFSQSSPLMRYGLGSVPSIHIIVKNGRVRLAGVVSSLGDKTIATMRVNGLPGIFSVENQLHVSKG